VKQNVFIVIVVLTLITFSYAQDDRPAPLQIEASNFARLQSVQQIDFANFDAEFDSGWFAMDAQGKQFVISDQTGRVYVMHVNGLLIDSFSVLNDGVPRPGSLIDAAFMDATLYTLHIIDGQTYVGNQAIETDGEAVAIWASGDSLYIEVAPDASSAQTTILEFEISPANGQLQQVAARPYYPAQAGDGAVVRVGRIVLPFVVTSDLNGRVTLWDLSVTNAMPKFRTDNGEGVPSVFGNINREGTHLVWRDNPNEALYILNFETGENQLIDRLNGAYAQWYFLSPNADVIFAVNFDVQAIVVAWNTLTGERLTLGEYRQCERPQPDMARLSLDGTTLAIGCDTGLDIWRVVND